MDTVSQLPHEAESGQMVVDFEAIFRAEYARIARVISRVIHDRARAEELAVEVFLKFWQTPAARRQQAPGWLYRTAIRKSLDELRKITRRARYETLLGFGKSTTPEEVFASMESQRKVRSILTVIDRQYAELLLLRSHGFSYEDLACLLDLNPTSVGTLLSRAHESFRKEYIKRYGKE